MNFYGLIILATLLADYGLNTLADLVNLKALRPELPKEMEGIYDAAAYRKSQEYTRATTRFGIIQSTVTLGATLLFWMLGGFNRLDRIVTGWGMGPVPTGVAYIGLLLLLQSLLALPFELYSTFVIEERFGFNKTKPVTFIADRLKGIALAALLGGPLLAALLVFFQFAGPHAWLYAWIATGAFLLSIQTIAPTWIMPMFNKFTPLAEGALRKGIFDYARSVEFPIDNVFVIDGSRRSSKTNAFFTGFGKRKRIALFDTLVARHTVPELVAVLAHEIGHYKKKHILQGMVISLLHTGLLFFLLSVFISRSGLYDAFYMEGRPIYAGLVFFAMLFTPVEFILSIFFQMISRHNEYEADRYAAETIEDPNAMAEALKRLSVDNLSNLTPHPFYVFLNYSHPPVLERAKAIRALAQVGRVKPSGSLSF